MIQSSDLILKKIPNIFVLWPQKVVCITMNGFVDLSALQVQQQSAVASVSIIIIIFFWLK